MNSEDRLLLFYDVRRGISDGAIRYDDLKRYYELMKLEHHKRACSLMVEDPKRSEIELVKSAVYLHLADEIVNDLNQQIESIEQQLKRNDK